jgi:aspartyl/asparaginyl beta-hydroxylase (cupin superfamily)
MLHSSIIEEFESKIDLIRDTYEHIKIHTAKWPELHLYSGDWSAILLKYNYEYLFDTPLNDLLIASPVALFSILKPNTVIKKHTGYKGYSEHVWRFHICLQTSSDAVLFVDSIPHRWIEGRGFYFDDTKEHWGWNNGETDRVVLVFDVPRTAHKPQMVDNMKRQFL